MSDYLPLDIQSTILKLLPVKSLIQFRSVSKQWKSVIDSPKFVQNYHLNHPNPQHHLLLRYGNVDTVPRYTYTSIVDNDTFPQHKLPLTLPGSHISFPLSSVNGLLCYFGFQEETNTGIAVIWNPSIRKSVTIFFPKKSWSYNRTVVGFGVSPRTSDPKLVKIRASRTWVVEVFTLSTRQWETVYIGAPFRPCLFTYRQVSIDGVIYWRASSHNNVIDSDDDHDDPDDDDHDDFHLFFLNSLREERDDDDDNDDDGNHDHHHDEPSNLIISFDLKSQKFGEVCLPEALQYAHNLQMMNVNESLVLLHYYNDAGEAEGAEPTVCGVWTRKDGENTPFTKIYTLKIEGMSLYNNILGFRENGEVVIRFKDRKSGDYKIKAYEPSSGRINSVGIIGNSFSVRSYMETLLLLDESNTIIHS